MSRNNNCIKTQNLNFFITLTMKNTDFWNMIPCSLVHVYRRSGATCLGHLQSKGGVKMEAETLINIYQIIQRHISVSSKLQHLRWISGR
jgi:hypothetical protein